MGWLEKYENGGDLQEYQPNFNESKVSTPPNFEGLGTLNKGFDYNSSWGGRWKNGGSMKYYQNGLDFKPNNISQNGRIIKDNNGYWNPDNWGHPVEIDSNIITMEGVDQPLIGISDVGDVKVMTPGERYKFNGKRVREFPIAKNGKELIKLDQLTNFTNYNKPQPGGWLSKYE